MSTITPRQPQFNLGEDLPTWWFDRDITKTLVMTAQSCTFPEGERFFIRSVRNFQDKVKSPTLQKAIRGFIGQEAHHGNAHEDLNALMASRGLPTRKIENFVKNGLAFRERIMSPERRLAMTCALEHFTAMLAELVLTDPEFLKGMDTRVRALWVWHAIEESEHKAVAFDVYQETVGDYWIRSSQMVTTSIQFMLFSLMHFIALYRSLEEKPGLWDTLKGIGYFLGPTSKTTKLLPRYLSYFRPGFHPGEVDGAQERARALTWVSEQLDVPLSA
ncbi:MAG: metal-dependent hydrolase [Pseudomonadota bacterium]|nr:metal-dependent hydrolase [Pseudomonadota bacterium]